MLLRRELKTPFVHLCNGKFGRIQRFLGMSLGVAITFAAYRYEVRIVLLKFHDFCCSEFFCRKMLKK